MELETTMITSWNGITAHAIERAGAGPERSRTKATRMRYTPTAAKGSRSHFAIRQRPRP